MTSGPSPPAGLRPEDAALLARLDPQRWAENGVPTARRMDEMAKAVDVVEVALTRLGCSPAVRISPLGPGWSRDVDVHVRAVPSDQDLETLGWLHLDGLLRRVGSPGRGRWGIAQGADVLACADLSTEEPPDPVQQIVARCRSRSEIRLREVLELRVLSSRGIALPPDAVVRMAARAEAALGGEDLAASSDGPPLSPPIALHRGLRSRLGRLRAGLRRRVVVGVSGVDGAGKSTLTKAIAADLERLGVPASLVWTRPGMGVGMGPFERAASLVKRMLRHGSTPGVRRVAEGQSIPWRKGFVGWSWALLITLSFLADVRRQHLRSRGVVLYDRHLLDALVTLDFVYGAVNLNVHRALIRRLLPRSSLNVYLDVPVDVAVARKPGDTFGELAVRRQLDGYRERLGAVPGIEVLDATLPSGELARTVLDRLIRSA